MFSPIFWTRFCLLSSKESDNNFSKLASGELRHISKTSSAKVKKLASLATKSVSQLISIKIELLESFVLDRIIPSTAALDDFFSAFKALFFLKFVIARSASPSASSKAFLHSIMPNPVFSLKSLTSLALIFIFSSYFLWNLLLNLHL